MDIWIAVNGNGLRWQLGAYSFERMTRILAGALVSWRGRTYGWEIASLGGALQYTIFHGGDRETWILQPPVRRFGPGW